MGITAIPPARLESWGSCAKQSKEITRQIKEEINTFINMMLEISSYKD